MGNHKGKGPSKPHQSKQKKQSNSGNQSNIVDDTDYLPPFYTGPQTHAHPPLDPPPLDPPLLDTLTQGMTTLSINHQATYPNSTTWVSGHDGSAQPNFQANNSSYEPVPNHGSLQVSRTTQQSQFVSDPVGFGQGGRTSQGAYSADQYAEWQNTDPGFEALSATELEDEYQSFPVGQSSDALGSIDGYADPMYATYGADTNLSSGYGSYTVGYHTDRTILGSQPRRIGDNDYYNQLTSPEEELEEPFIQHGTDSVNSSQFSDSWSA